MKPSMTTKAWRAAAPRMMPVMQPISKPPTFRKTSNPSRGSGWFTRSDCRTTSILTLRRSSEILVPRPVASSGARPQNVAATQAEEVVLAIPISPGKKQQKPSAAADAASSIPVSTALIACSRVIAGPTAQFFVPKAIFRDSSPGRWSVGAAIPRSATTSSEPAKFESALATAPREMR